MVTKELSVEPKTVVDSLSSVITVPSSPLSDDMAKRAFFPIVGCPEMVNKLRTFVQWDDILTQRRETKMRAKGLFPDPEEEKLMGPVRKAQYRLRLETKRILARKVDPKIEILMNQLSDEILELSNGQVEAENAFLLTAWKGGYEGLHPQSTELELKNPDFDFSRMLRGMAFTLRDGFRGEDIQFFVVEGTSERFVQQSTHKERAAVIDYYINRPRRKALTEFGGYDQTHGHLLLMHLAYPNMHYVLDDVFAWSPATLRARPANLAPLVA